jgi:hypothetical protein
MLRTRLISGSVTIGDGWAPLEVDETDKDFLDCGLASLALAADLDSVRRHWRQTSRHARTSPDRRATNRAHNSRASFANKERVPATDDEEEVDEEAVDDSVDDEEG